MENLPSKDCQSNPGNKEFMPDKKKESSSELEGSDKISKSSVDGISPQEYNEESSFPDGGMRAWLNVIGALCFGTATFGLVNSYVFQAYYSDVLMPHSSPSALSWIGSIQYALTFFPAVFTGRLFDLGYFRVLTSTFSIILIVCTLLVAECKEYWQFLLCQGFAVGLSAGVLFGPTLNCVAHWFKKRRSTAFGVVACGSSIGGTLFPILSKNLIPRVGFPWTMRILAFVLLFFVGMGNLVMRRRLPPINVSGGLFNIRVLKHAPFALYTIAGFICFLGLLTYIDSSAVFYGVDPGISFYLVAVANAASAIGRITTGLLADRLGPLNCMIPFTVIAGGLTIAWPFARGTSSLIAIAVLYGMSSGAFVGLLSLPVANMGEIGDVGRRQGMLFTILSVGAILGPPISGQIKTSTGGYVAVGLYAGITIFAGVVFLMAARAYLTGHVIGGKA